MPHHDDRFDDPLDLWLEGRLTDAYGMELELETAARHLWVIHRSADPREPTSARPAELAGAAMPATQDDDRAADGARRPRSPRRARENLPRLAGTGVRGLVLAVAFATVLSTSGIAAASGRALPGQALYPFKLTAERVQLLVSVGAQRDAQLHLRIGRTRLAEAAAVARARPADVLPLLGAAVDAVERAERSGGVRVQRDAVALREETGTVLHTLAVAVGPEDSSGLAVVAERLGLATVAQSPVLESDAAAPAPPADAGSSAWGTAQEVRVPADPTRDALPVPTAPPGPSAASGDAVTRTTDAEGPAVRRPSEAPGPAPTAEPPGPAPSGGSPTATPSPKPAVKPVEPPNQASASVPSPSNPTPAPAVTPDPAKSAPATPPAAEQVEEADGPSDREASKIDRQDHRLEPGIALAAPRPPAAADAPGRSAAAGGPVPPAHAGAGGTGRVTAPPAPLPRTEPPAGDP